MDGYEAIRFGITEDHISTAVHEAYNTLALPILGLREFKDSALEILHTSPNPLSFYERLEK